MEAVKDVVPRLSPADRARWTRLMAEDEQLAQMREALPGWILYRATGGFRALWLGTEHALAATTLGELDSRISELTADGR